MLTWSSSPIATWSASVGLNADGNIAAFGETEVKKKTFSVKGQNPNNESEDESYGYLGNAFSELFGMYYLSNITRKISDTLG